MEQPAKKWIKPREHVRIFGVGLTRTYELIALGELEARKDGRGTLISVESAERRIAKLPRLGPKAV